MPNYLITGMSGSGKSATGDTLRKKGFAVIDVDFKDATSWVDAKTHEPAAYKPGDGYERIRELLYFWKPGAMLPLLEASQSSATPHFFDGYAQNIQDFYPYFSKMFILIANEDIVSERLHSRVSGDWGKDPGELQQSIEDLVVYQNQLKQAGAIAIDSTQPIEQIVNGILGHVTLN
jgi:hypothetical protein